MLIYQVSNNLDFLTYVYSHIALLRYLGIHLLYLHDYINKTLHLFQHKDSYDFEILDGVLSLPPKCKTAIFIKTYVYRKDSTPNMANENSYLTIDKGLPKIRFSLSPGGMGYAGIMLFNREELISKNSWSEDINIDKLPVFKNDMPTDLLQLEDYFPR